MEYMELYERGEHPSLQERIERYPGFGEAEREMRLQSSDPVSHGLPPVSFDPFT